MRHFCALLTGLAIFSLAFASEAQELEGRFRMGFEGTLLAIEKQEITGQTGTGFGAVEVSSETTDTTFALLAGGGGVVVGLALSEYIEVGGRFLLASVKSSDDDSSAETSATAISLLPELRALFVPEGPLRPFVAGTLGVEFTSIDTTVDDIGLESSVSGSALVYGLGVGLHGFVNDGFSIDPQFYLTWANGSLSPEDGEDFDFKQFQAFGGVAIHGWF